MSTYLSAFFSLPVKRSTGEKLNHEEVVHRLDSDTVSYEVALGVNSVFTETMRVSIKVETAQYEHAIAWLKDLVYGSEFDKDRYVCVPHASFWCRLLIHCFLVCKLPLRRSSSRCRR